MRQEEKSISARFDSLKVSSQLRAVSPAYKCSKEDGTRRVCPARRDLTMRDHN